MNKRKVINGLAVNFVLILIIVIGGVLCVLGQTSSSSLNGEITDQNNAIIINAEISLSNQNGFEEKAVSNNLGEFSFRDLSQGTYTLRVVAKGFAEYKKEIKFDSETKLQLPIVLYPVIKENVEIDEESNRLSSDSSSGAIILTEKDLDIFSNDPDQFREQLEQLAASTGGEPGQTTVSVDGLQNNGRLPSKSSISRIRINSNPYSAEYQTTPRGGRVEITTKPGSRSFHGSAFFNYNTTNLNARNPFASRRAETSKNHYGFNISGPIVKNKSGYFFDFEKRDIDQVSTVNAIILDDNLQTSNFIFNSPTPQRLLNGSARADWLLNPSNTLIVRYNFNRNKLENQGIRGTNLPERGYDNIQTQNNFRLSETAVINAQAVNEFRLRYTLNKIEQTALSNQETIQVAGAFTSGGANLQKLERDEKILQIVNQTTIESGKHRLKFGVQIFNNRISELRAVNTNGTFFFGGTEIPNGSNIVSLSSLEQYRRTLQGLPGGVPTRFYITQGVPVVSVNQWLFGGFVQEEWKIHPQAQISMGLRLEAQTSPSDSLRFAPRLGIAYSPDKKNNWVFRARAGIYYNRIYTSLPLETERLDGENQRQIIIDSPSFPDPFLNGIPVNTIPTIRTIDSNLRSPASANMRLELERKLPKGWTLRASHSWSRDWSQLRSRNINAPLVDELNPDPNAAPRPFGINQNILQFESSGRREGRALYLGISQFRNRRFSLNLGYLNLDYRTNTDGPFSLPQSSYISINEFGRTTSQSNHRLFFFGRLNLFYGLRLSGNFNAASGRHFDITTGRDNNSDGNFNDRPNVTSSNDSQAIETEFGFLNPNVINGNLRRNTGITPVYINLNLNLSRSFGFGKKDGRGRSPYNLTTTITANNILNRSNLTGNVGVLSSPLFNQPTYAFPARRIEFGLRFSF